MLEVEELTVRYGPVLAVDRISFCVEPGEIVVLIGANGAGKSSVVNAVGGLLGRTRGAVRFRGEDVGALAAAGRVQRGLALVIEGRGVFAEMTVRENLELGGYSRRDLRGAALRSAVERAIAQFPRLGERLEQLAGTLSGGEQQMLGIARALIARPRLLALDEPSLGLAPRIVEEIAEHLIRLAKDDGIAILIAEQNAALGLDIAQRAYVLQNGRVALSGAASDIAANERLGELYLGG